MGRSKALLILAMAVVTACGSEIDELNDLVEGETLAIQVQRRCGAEALTTAQVATIEAATSSLMGAQSLATTAAAGAIGVYWHVIRDSAGGGGVAQSKILQSIDVLNAAYGPKGFTFEWQATTYSNNTSWYTAARGSSAENEMKSLLHQSNRNTLNIYSTYPADYLGWATFPWNYLSNPTDDGVVIRRTTIPGGTETNYNQGDTLVHEVGHWLGLYHTFQNGCTSPGDSVGDTPYEASAAFGCPIGRNSCSQSGNDPIRNYMDYTYDSCTDNFTSGQGTRMNSIWTTYRSCNPSGTYCGDGSPCCTWCQQGLPPVCH